MARRRGQDQAPPHRLPQIVEVEAARTGRGVSKIDEYNDRKYRPNNRQYSSDRYRKDWCSFCKRNNHNNQLFFLKKKPRAEHRKFN